MLCNHSIDNESRIELRSLPRLTKVGSGELTNNTIPAGVVALCIRVASLNCILLVNVSGKLSSNLSQQL